MFKVEYHPKVLKKDLKKIPYKDLELIKTVIEEKLMTKPEYFGKPLRNSLKFLHSLRIKNYRIIYQIKNKKLLILILIIEKRETVYKSIDKRI